MNTMVPLKNSTTATLLSAAGSAIAIVIFIRKINRELGPFGFHGYMQKSLLKVVTKLSSQLTMVIEEFADDLTKNQIYSAAKFYLGAKVPPPSTRRLKVSKHVHDETYMVSRIKEEEITDVFEGIRCEWVYKTRTRHPQSINPSKISSFELSFHKNHREKVLDFYLPYIVNLYKASLEENRTIKLHTLATERLTANYKNSWSSTKLNHPATFDKLAMDYSMKKMIMDDLDKFINRKEYYNRVGKAWKRGYLLYGPPGTGKSSLIAAIANYLRYDIFDLDLTDIKSNSDLRRLLLSTKSRSIVVVEDIDRSLDFQKTKSTLPEKAGSSKAPKQNDDQQMTLSGMLNFIDGLWSSCGEKRIIIFTTNNKERLDHALLRPGRMDMHIHMSYCTPSGFKILANNYLQVCDHPVFRDIEQLLETTNVTPAEIAGELLKNEDGPDATLESLVEFIRKKTTKNLLNEAMSSRIS